MLQKNFRQRSKIDSKVVILNFQKVEPLYGYPLEFELSANCFKKIVICTLLRIILTLFFQYIPLEAFVIENIIASTLK